MNSEQYFIIPTWPSFNKMNRVYLDGGICPTLTTQCAKSKPPPSPRGGGGTSVKSGLKLITATAQGWMEATDGDGVVLNFLGRARGRVQKGKSPTIHTDGGGLRGSLQ